MAEAAAKPATLNGLDWLVIVAATVALVVLVVWLTQGPPKSLGKQKPDGE